jgi:hypothetical protein
MGVSSTPWALPSLVRVILRRTSRIIRPWAIGSEAYLGLESHLLECQACREKLSQCIASQLVLRHLGRPKSEEKYERSEPRFRTGADAILQEISPWSVERGKVEIVDISKNGIGILSPKSVFPETIVQVRIRGTVELAEVRHCSGCGEIGYRYRIALRLHDEF